MNITFNLTTEQAINPGTTIYFTDIIGAYVTYYSDLLAFCTVTVFFLFMFNEYFLRAIKKECYAPLSATSGLIGPKKREIIAKGADIIGDVVTTLGIMCSVVLLYTVMIEGLMSWKYWVFLIVGVGFWLFGFLLNLFYYIRKELTKRFGQVKK